MPVTTLRVVHLDGLPANVGTAGTLGCETGSRAFLNQPPRKLGERGEVVEHKLTRCGGGVDDAIADGVEPNATLFLCTSTDLALLSGKTLMSAPRSGTAEPTLDGDRESCRPLMNA